MYMQAVTHTHTLVPTDTQAALCGLGGKWLPLHTSSLQRSVHGATVDITHTCRTVQTKENMQSRVGGMYPC